MRSSSLYVLCCAALLALGVAPVASAQEAGVYVVEEGDTLYRIAQEHDLSVAQLRRLNDLENNTIRPGQELRVRPPEEGPAAEKDTPEENGAPPAPDSSASELAERAKPPGEAPAATDTSFYGSHTAEAGATLYTIAARYATSVDTLSTLNRSVGIFLEPGEELRLPPSLGPPAHTVEAGETIYDVARRYGVSAKLLQRANGLEGKQVREGQRLRIPGREAPEPQPEGTRRPVREAGAVARYPASYEGRLMAGGARYDPARYVVSHPSLPIGTVVLLTNPATGRQTFAEVADRGPLDEQYVMDTSAAVWERLGLAEGSSQSIEVRVMD